MKLKTGLALGGFGAEPAETIRLISEAGLDSFFTGTPDRETLKYFKNLADQYELYYSSLHAPFKNAAVIWDNTPAGEAAQTEIENSIDSAASVDVPILVVHPFIGFDQHTPTKTGLERFKKLAEHAEKKNIKLAIENVEGEEYLDCLLVGLSDYDSVGFCLDTGHMMCYNHGRDFLSEYGNRLIYTHINDNEGCTYPNGKIFWHDDAHLLPFDGIQNWDKLTKQFKQIGYQGPLTLELTKASKPGRTANDIYKNMSTEEYVFEAASRIKKIAEMVENA